MITVMYFARLREQLGLAQETLPVPQPQTVAGLLALLRTRGDAWASELHAARVFRVAVNQDMAGQATALASGDEVAIFPPVTGG